MKTLNKTIKYFVVTVIWVGTARTTVSKSTVIITAFD